MVMMGEEDVDVDVDVDGKEVVGWIFYPPVA
jgi:hypothetical protein